MLTECLAQSQHTKLAQEILAPIFTVHALHACIPGPQPIPFLWLLTKLPRNNVLTGPHPPINYVLLGPGLIHPLMAWPMVVPKICLLNK